MRLLNTDTLIVEEFLSNIPPYAILSHTWAEEEVLFEEVGTPQAENKLGFQKIKKCCAQAKSDDFLYVWVDTCCIDKRSSSELSEAINSMFRWYQEAQVCYAHLFDLGEDEGVTELGRCRWFSRGWTLQELIAPDKLVFYAGENWRELGTKSTLGDSISAITGIDQEFLWNKPDWRYSRPPSVAQKLSWASRRQTTRVEDAAYSLLGIFQVNMPLLYGEGMNAFFRLQLLLLNHSNEHTIFAWNLKFTRYRGIGLLAPSPAAFAYCGDIIKTSDIDTPPHTMTNIGLSITLPLLRVVGETSEVYRAYLSCENKNNNERICIYLLRGRASHFSRLVGRLVPTRKRNWAQRTILFADLTPDPADTMVSGLAGVAMERVHNDEDLDVADAITLPEALQGFRQVDSMALPEYSPQHPMIKGLHHLFWDMWRILAHSYIHALLVFVPLGIIAGLLHWNPPLLFVLNFLAIIPLCSLVGSLSEGLPAKIGPKWGGLMEETLGNTVELLVRLYSLGSLFR